MGVEIVTAEDLESFRLKLLNDIAKLISEHQPKTWVKTQEVMEMLGVSEVTLQTLRNKGIIPFRKLGGICYYNIDELDQAMRNL